MPLYFFDTDDGDLSLRDDEGVELSDLDAARTAAVDALPDIAREVLPDGGRRTIAVTVRDEAGHPLLRASLTLNVDVFVQELHPQSVAT